MLKDQFTPYHLVQVVLLTFSLLLICDFFEEHLSPEKYNTSKKRVWTLTLLAPTDQNPLFWSERVEVHWLIRTLWIWIYINVWLTDLSLSFTSKLKLRARFRQIASVSEFRNWYLVQSKLKIWCCYLLKWLQNKILQLEWFMNREWPPHVNNFSQLKL